ncbi:hypothetical protein ScPMuIL_016747 [Solemya velum]
MFGVTGLSRFKRLILGLIVLLFVDFLWVASSELTEYIFKDAEFSKPFFTTYVKTAMFMLYLTGFLVWKPWRQQCEQGNKVSLSENYLSQPIYVPVKTADKESGTESEDSRSTKERSVHFSNLSEIRQMPDQFADEAHLARLSYTASVRMEEARIRALHKLTLKQVAKIAFIFSILWFCANISYQEALLKTEAGVVNVLSSTSGLFTLVCAAIYPSNSADRFTLSKLVAVLLSIGGIVVVSLSDIQLEKKIPVGALWALCGAILYSFYLVSLKRKCDHEDKLDIPMFFGFVGFFCTVLVWPVFFFLHLSGQEEFQWPNKEQWLYIALNGLLGTVLSELLWLWGCFLTSSLIATLSLSLTIPMTTIADIVIKGVPYTWMFYVGTVPVFLSFFAVSILTHYDNWDPALTALKNCLNCLWRQRLKHRLPEVDREQTESLISNGEH